MRVRSGIILAAALVLLAAACGGGDDNDSSPTPTRQPGDESATPPGDAIAIRAENNQFDREEISVKPGADIFIGFSSADAAPHNVAIYESSAAEEEIFVGDTIVGPDEAITYEFVAPEEIGTYFFRCDVHPVDMTGNFIVEEG